MEALKTTFKNKLHIRDYYRDEAKCRELLAQRRWNGNVVCPHCGTEKPYVTNRGFKCSSNKCYKKFSVTTGTVYHNTKIKLNVWFEAIYVITAHKKGISSHQLARDLGITQKSAWFILHRVRQMLQEIAPQVLSGVVEIDETFVGGLEANKHGSKRTKGLQGRNSTKKVPVLGILERGGNVIAIPVKNTSGKELLPHMVVTVAPGSTICTDEYSTYQALALKYNHKVVNHSSAEYVRGVHHTQNIEGFWSQLKRGIHGIYHSVSPKHLDAYCNEYAFRYNTRKISDSDRFFSVLNRSGNFVLPYQRLIAKSNALGMDEESTNS